MDTTPTQQLFTQVGVHLLLLGAGFLPLYSIYRLLMSPLSSLPSLSKSVNLGWIYDLVLGDGQAVDLREHYDPLIHTSPEEVGICDFSGREKTVLRAMRGYQHLGLTRLRPVEEEVGDDGGAGTSRRVGRERGDSFTGFRTDEFGGFARSKPLVYRDAVLWQAGGW